jgi:mono/diheme cytochrome c family protein
VRELRIWNGRAPQIVAGLAVLAAVVATWALVRPLTEVQRHRRHLAELQRQIAAASETRTTRAADRSRIMRLRAQARTASGSQREAFDAEAAAIETRLGWSDRDVVRAAVLRAPLVSAFRSAPVPRDVVPTSSANADGCIACHVSIATPGFENYPAPYRTHPHLSSYVGAASSHPPSRVACVSCHQGDGHADSFAGAGHSTLRTASGEAVVRSWIDPNAAGAMLPAGRVEAACASCHGGERYQPGAPSLNEALTTLDRAGCYACHDIPGMERAARRGPDLRRIGSKLSPQWVRAWLADPRAVKPATWMPRFWSPDAMSPEDAAAIDAVTAYLFESSQPWTPMAANPPRGDARRGQALAEAVGCLGCHVIGDAPRDQIGVRRTFGQPLDGLAEKTSYAWLVDWVREPSHYSAGTRMPNLRLTVQEAADVATYLATLSRTPPRAPEAANPDDEQYRAVIRRYADAAREPTMDAGRLTGAPLRVAAGRTAIDALGCFNCHEIGGFEERRRSAPLKARAVWLDADGSSVHRPGATASASARQLTPDFGFAPTEGARLALALTSVAGRPGAAHSISMPWHAVKVAGRTLVQERNCVGCHPIEGVGGDFVNLVAEPTLGPPLLTPEGSRVQAAWLDRFLREPRTIRPWLAVRMPAFNLTDDEVERVGGYLRAIAPPNPEPTLAPTGATSTAGRELFDLLKCQQCHVLGTIPRDQPTSNLAPDLRLAHERLQPEWIDAWLRNPSAILPGTRMPTFWPDYPKSFYDPLNRDGAAQVRAIREHLLTLR